MKKLTAIILIFVLLSCKSEKPKNGKKKMQNDDLETLAFEGINIDFQFNSYKPTFGDLFLIVGFENPKFIPKNREFEKLNKLGFEQTDDYFGIRNQTEIGSDIEIWLFPIISGKEVYHENGPFDAIRISYSVVVNEENTAEIFENIFNAIMKNLDVTPTFEGKRIENYEEIQELITKTIQYCKRELKVEPGSEEALELEW